MTLIQWFIFFLILQAVHFLGTWKLYQKAGRKPWEAAVPVYNAIVLMQIIRRPRWWVILLFIPIVNLIMFPVIWVETLRSFGKNSLTDTFLGVFTLGLYIYYINYAEDVQYQPERDLKPKSKSGDTVSSLLFAVVVATLVHTYVMQPFTIPTASLEKTLLIGDFLFVSKFHYGARTPMTTVAAPMVHDTIPILRTKSYTNWPQLPYFRFPGVEEIEKNDIVVFNWPTDTVTDFKDRESVGIRKPIDKRTNYVKRCVGTPGDSISIKDGVVYINGKELLLSDRAKLQYHHTAYSKTGISPQMFVQVGAREYYRTFITSLSSEEQFNAIGPYLRSIDRNEDGTLTIRTGEDGIPPRVLQKNRIGIREVVENQQTVNLTLSEAEALRNITGVDSVVRVITRKPESVNTEIFPHTKNWTFDNMGPVYIPEAGKTVELNRETLPFYELAIREYEHNDLKVEGDAILINGQPVTSYTFKQDYYWMMGDNRHNSLDSRAWGYVPFDHVVGKPVFVWMSLDGWKPRWNRFFTTVGGDGEPVSYFKYFLGLLALWFVFDYFRKKRKVAKS